MPVSDDHRVALWREVLTLSKMTSGENVVILTGESSNRTNLDAAMRASLLQGATVMRLDLPPAPPSRNGIGGLPQAGVTPLSRNRLAVETLKQANMIIDLVGLLHSSEQLEILRSGARILMVIEPPEILAQIVPAFEDKERVMTADARLRAAKKMRVTSKAGTDLILEIGQYDTLPEYGFADEPGHWDHWPSGFLSTWPTDGSANGRVVVNVGDMLFPMKMYVTTPVVFEIRNGFIQSIEGGFEATYVRRHIEAYRDPNAYAVSHVGWGLQPKAKWGGLGLRDKVQSVGMDSRAFAGNFLFSTGPNGEGGGSNHTPCHVDIPMADCSVFLDGVAVTRDGKLVEEPTS